MAKKKKSAYAAPQMGQKKVTAKAGAKAIKQHQAAAKKKRIRAKGIAKKG